MSNLSDHARAFRVLGEVLQEQAGLDEVRADGTGRLLMCELGVALDIAANRLEAEVRASVVDHACTIDHAALTVPKCPACGAPRR